MSNERLTNPVKALQQPLKRDYWGRGTVKIWVASIKKKEQSLDGEVSTTSSNKINTWRQNLTKNNQKKKKTW